jgi:hypothetical protein
MEERKTRMLFMYSDLCDFIKINGLESITVLFNVLTKRENNSWKHIIETDGPDILQIFSEKPVFTLQEVNETVWSSNSEPMRDKFYSIQLKKTDFNSNEEFLEALQFLIQIKKEYPVLQVYINNIYQLDDKAQGLVDYVRMMGTHIN